MAGNANRNPSGLVELCNLNLQGEFPRALGNMIIPGIEMADWFLAGIGLRYATAIALAAVPPGPMVGLTMPAGERWAVRAISFSGTNLDPSAAYSGSLRGFGNGVADEVILARESFGTVVLNHQFTIGAVFERPLILDNEFLFRFYVDSVTGIPAAGINGTLTVAYYNLAM